MAKRKTRRERRTYSDKYKQKVLKLVSVGDESVSQICRELELTPSADPLLLIALRTKYKNGLDPLFLFLSRSAYEMAVSIVMLPISNSAVVNARLYRRLQNNASLADLPGIRW